MMRESRFSPSKKFKKISGPPQPPRRMAAHPIVKINDQVQTPHGAGKVIEISDDLYLVALEGQIAKVWERISSLKILPSK